MPSGDIGEILKRSLCVLAHALEKQKFGKCSRHGQRRGSKNSRSIPLAVKLAVWERDGGQCTFVGTGGKRCDARAPLETLSNDGLAWGRRKVRRFPKLHSKSA